MVMETTVRNYVDSLNLLPNKKDKIAPKVEKYQINDEFTLKVRVFQIMVEKTDFDGNESPFYLSKLLVNKGTLPTLGYGEEYKDVFINSHDHKALVGAYNELKDRKYNIVVKKVDKINRYFLVKIKQDDLITMNLINKNRDSTKLVVSVHAPYDPDNTLNKDIYCVQYVINKLKYLFSIGKRNFNQKEEFYGDKHPEGITKYRVNNSHISAAKKYINFNSEEFGFIVKTGCKLEAVTKKINFNNAA